MSFAGPLKDLAISPDGRWMAYQSDESGAFEICVRPFPQVEESQVQVSNNSGLSPLWSGDGRELFYLQPGVACQLMLVSLDGQRFLAIRAAEGGGWWRGRSAGDHRRSQLVRGAEGADAQLTPDSFGSSDAVSRLNASLEGRYAIERELGEGGMATSLGTA